MFFNSVKKINRLRKEINRLVRRGMSNVLLKVAIENSWRSQNIDFLGLKNLWPGQFWRASTHWILKLFVAT